MHYRLNKQNDEKKLQKITKTWEKLNVKIYLKSKKKVDVNTRKYLLNVINTWNLKYFDGIHMLV